MIETLLLYAFGAVALLSAAVMLVVRHPMRVALALVTTMLSLGAIYGLLGVHVIAVFQVLIYVGAVMVFMVYVIMLLDLRDSSFTDRFSRLIVPGIAGGLLFLGALGYAVWHGPLVPSSAAGDAPFGLQQFSAAFLHEYWLYFELTSVLLVAVVVAALAVIKGSGRGRG